MKTGDIVIVAGKAGQVTARVLDCTPATDMPDLSYLCDVSEEARKILAEEFQNVAVIAYRFGPERIPVIFVALEDSGSTWWDLHGHQLSITPATPATTAEAAKEEPAPCATDAGTSTTPANADADS